MGFPQARGNTLIIPVSLLLGESVQVGLKINSEDIKIQQFRTRIRTASVRALIMKCAYSKPRLFILISGVQ